MAHTDKILMRKHQWSIWASVVKKVEADRPEYTQSKEEDKIKILGDALGKDPQQLKKYQDNSAEPHPSTILSWLKFLEYGSMQEYEEQFLNLKQKVYSDSFLSDIEQLLSSRKGKLLSSPDAAHTLSNPEKELLLKLAGNLKSHYTTNAQFTSIGLLPDKEGRFGHFGHLSMEDQFIQLSYLSLEDARRRDSVEISESELNSTKINRSTSQNLKLSHDYIVNYRFRTIRQLLIIGSPGVGKSTFSRWYCYEWTKDPTLIEQLPIFIELKRLHFDTEDNPLASYVSKQYGMEQISPQTWISLFRKASGTICFVLDGYDELPEGNKQKLSAALADFSRQCKYMLTSRPYGVLNTYGLSFTDSIQLDGLDMAGIHSYIDNFLKSSGTASKKRLLKIIDVNPTLSDFAHNPLLLSFMVVIYLSDHAAEQTLGGVQSRFDLQNRVVGWMTSHRAKEVSQELADHAAVLAYDMTLKKNYERVETQKLGLYSTFRSLSDLGIGQMAEHGNSSFKFYFNTLSFQEYFAARAILEMVTTAAFYYLLKDRYFWNLCAMIAGGIKNHKILSDTIKLCEQDIKNTIQYSRDSSSYYKYTLLLSECPDQFLKNIITEEQLVIVYEGYRIAMQQDPAIAMAMVECITRLYRKLNTTHQYAFKSIVLKAFTEYIEEEWDDEYEAWNEHYTHIPALIEGMELMEDTGFCIELCNIFLALLRKQDGTIDDLDELYTTLLDIIVKRRVHALTTQASSKTLMARLQEINELLPEDYIVWKAELALYYADEEKTIRQLQELPAKQPQSKEAAELQIGALAQALFVLMKSDSLTGLPKINRKELKRTVETSAGILISYLQERGKDPEGQIPEQNKYTYRNLLYMVAVAVSEWGDPQMIKEAMDLMGNAEDMKNVEFELYDETGITDFFEQLVQSGKEAHVTDDLKHLLMLIHHFPLLKNKIAPFRITIVSRIAAYIKEHETILQQYKTVHLTKINGKKDGNEVSGVIDTLIPFFNLMSGDGFKIYESDKHYFLRYLLKNGLSGTAYFQKSVLRHVFPDQISIYDELYWKDIIQCLNSTEPEVVANGLYVCTNSTIYNYAINLDQIKNILDLAYQKLLSGEIPKGSVTDILFIVAHTLMAIKRNETNSLLASEIIDITGCILKLPDIRSETKANGMIAWDLSQQAAYILQQYLTGNEAYNLKVNYIKKMKNNSIGVEKLTSDLYFTLSKNGVLNLQDATFIHKVAGKELQEKLMNMNTDFHLSKSAFEELC